MLWWSMDIPHDTVSALLLNAAQSQHKLGSGSFNTAYDLGSADSRFEGYVLRVRRYSNQHDGMHNTKSMFDHLLARHTALTPPAMLVSGLAVGQPLLEIPGLLDIVRREPGKSVDDWYRDLGKSGSPLHASTQLLETVLQTPNTHGENPFIPLFDQFYRLRDHGYEPDLRANGNVLLTANGHLSLIDQLQYDRPRTDASGMQAMLSVCQQRLREMFGGNPETINQELNHRRTHESDKTHYHELLGQLDGLLHEAKQHTLEKYANVTRSPSIFKTVENTKAVALGDPPHALLERLRALDAQAMGSARA